MAQKHTFRKLIPAFLLGMLMMSFAWSQEMTVKGVVKDNTGEALPGAEVMVVETGKGTVTDFDGKFTIKAAMGQHIKVHYLGYKTKTVPVNSDALVIILQPDAVGLDQVVVTGVSGEATKKQLGSTIETIKAEDLGKREVTTVTEALQGQISGAYISRNNGSPDGSISVRLRGTSTILGSSEPLIMIDGVIVNNEDRSINGLGSHSQNALVDLDLNDIDHIEVLKGPAASAIYGSIASNGIINIITKKGRSGEPSVSITSRMDYNTVRKYKPMNEVLLYKNTHTGTVEPLPASINGTELGRYDWGREYIFRPALGYYNSAQVTGGNDKTRYLISGGSLSNDGILRNTNFTRHNFKVKLHQKLAKWLDVTGSIYYARTKSKEIPFGDSWIANPMIGYMFGDNMVNPYPNEVGIYPLIKKISASDPNGGLSYLDYSGQGGQAWWGNPYEAIDLTDVGVIGNRMISDVQFKMKPFDGFNIRYTFGYDYSSTNQHFRLPYGFTSDRDGRLSKSNAFTRILNSAIDASYTYNLTDKLKLTTGLGYNYLYRGLETFSMSQRSLPIFDNIQVINGDNATGNGIYERALWGGYLQQVFNYDETFFLTLAGRMDGASTFGKDQRNQFYPKASFSVIMSNFDFIRDNLDFVNEFKIRGAYGEAGNLSVLDRPSLNYMYLGTLYNSGNYLGQNTYYPKTADGNPDIRPERSKEIEAGFDLSMFDNRLGIEFTYYKQNITDLVLNRVLAPSTGFTSRFENIGSVENKGFELSVNATPVQTNDFKWDLRATYSQNRNRAYDIPGFRIQMAGFGGTSVVQEGEPIGSFYLYYYATDANGNWVLDPNGNPQRARGHYEDQDGDGFAETPVQDFDSNGQPTGDLLRKIAGDPNPDFTASLFQTFTYKDFFLRVGIEAVQGFDVLNWDKRMAYRFPNGYFYGEELQLVHDGVKNPGWYSNRFFIWESFLEDGSFVKLREVSLGYNWKPSWKYLKQVRFTLTGSNLLSWDKYWGMDPEVNYMGRSNVGRSQDFGGIPIPRVYSFTVNLKF
ncbi:MAG: SusC/RagA family TonB-linked outer membrane protein [Chlorobi bacterium]|nr:SusC/RagA family TonB-linked outer membrane protein [Chlorobiota bacterium]